jgi:hypothetical protein
VTYGAKLKTWEGNAHALRRRLQHYAGVVTRLDAVQFRQVLADKMDPEHSVRRRMSRRVLRDKRPAVLLPTAYGNVSRTAIAYARLLPQQRFLLVHARSSGKLRDLPENVDSASLDGYFLPVREHEISSLLAAWEKLKSLLVPTFPEFVAAEAMGALGRFPSLLRWGLAIRDAWNHLLDVEEITACFSADNSNPYSRVPLILARQRGLPAVACHHGALDFRMILKGTGDADVYLAKGEMERDYLVRRCQAPGEMIVMGAAAEPKAVSKRRSTSLNAARPWMVFFTEPYAVFGWRVDEVYRELLPHLLALAESCGVQLVFKLHPFESVRGHRRLLRRHISREQERRIPVLSGPMTQERWSKVRLAMTVQSTMALECSERGIPAFLCSWLADTQSGYVEQFARYKVGHILNSVRDLAGVPHLLETNGRAPHRDVVWQAISPQVLEGLFLQQRRLAAAVNS